MLYWVHLTSVGFKLTTLVMIGTDCIGSFESDKHTITTMTAPYFLVQTVPITTCSCEFDFCPYENVLDINLCSFFVNDLWQVCGFSRFKLFFVTDFWQVCGFSRLMLLFVSDFWQVCGFFRLCCFLSVTFGRSVVFPDLCCFLSVTFGRSVVFPDLCWVFLSVTCGRSGFSRHYFSNLIILSLG